jgi:hypothetical protein
MKLLAIEMSRLTALFNVSRAAGQLYLPAAVSAISEQYSFVGVPKSLEELTSDRIELKQGQFQGNAIDSLDIYNDGIVIASRSDTDFIDRFFSDLCTWMADELGLSVIKTRLVDRIYDSNLVIESNENILSPLDALSDIAKAIETDLSSECGLEVNFEPFGMSLSADQTQNASLRPAVFRIERRIGIEFSLNQFVSTAPLTTQQHIRTLERLESLF